MVVEALALEQVGAPALEQLRETASQTIAIITKHDRSVGPEESGK